MKTKKKAAIRDPKKSQKKKVQKSLQSFKKIVESKFGKIKWKKLGLYSFTVLLYIASKGLLGFKAQFAAYQFVRFARFA